MIKLNFLLNATFRSNPEFELIEWGNLNQSEQEALSGLADNPDIYGVFRRPNKTESTIAKLAYTDVALLFFALRMPGNLPQYFQVAYDDEVNETMVKLILEGVFEIEVEGQFVSGASAQETVYFHDPETIKTSGGILSRLSAKAIEYALHLREADSRTLASKLYVFNSMPGFPIPEYDFDSVEKVEHFLGVGKDDIYSWELYKNWNKQEPTDSYHWLSWSRKDQAESHNSRENDTYKIYISPVLASFPEVFIKSVRALTKSKAFSFKTGMDRAGLLRPDKFVVYFHRHEDLLEAADLLKETLKGYESQGVPFTGALDDTGMLSWGVDPPNQEMITEAEGGSWRARISEKIAGTISQTDLEGLSEEKKLDFILNKISLDGINPVHWIPN